MPVLDSGARGSTITFVQRGIGDVLLAWENEALLVDQASSGADKFEIVAPSLSILAEPPVAVVDKVVDKQGHARGRQGLPGVPLHAARARRSSRENYLPPARCRRSPSKYASQFPAACRWSRSTTMFGGWAKAQATHFADGGVFDQIYQPGKSLTRWHRGRIRAAWRQPSILPGFGLTLGFTLAYLGLIVLIPLSAASLQGRRSSGWHGFWRCRRHAACGRPLRAELRRVARRGASINCVFGLLVAWVLVRYDFPGQADRSTRWSTCRSRCRPPWPASR